MFANPSQVPQFAPGTLDPELVRRVAEVLDGLEPAPLPLDQFRPGPLPFESAPQPSQTGPILEDVARAKVLEDYGVASQEDLALLLSPEGLALTAPEPFQPDPRLQENADRNQQLLDLDYQRTVAGIRGPETSSAYNQALEAVRSYVTGVTSAGTVDGNAAAQQILDSGTSRAQATQARGRSDTANLLGGFGASPALAQPTLGANAGAIGSVSASAQQILNSDTRYNERVEQSIAEISQLLGPVRAEEERLAVQIEQDALTQAAIEYSLQTDAIRDGVVTGNERAYEAWVKTQEKYEEELASRTGQTLESLLETQDTVVAELEQLGVYGLTSQTHTQNASRYIVNALTQSNDPLEQRGVAYALLAYESVMGDQAFSLLNLFDVIDQDPRFESKTERDRMKGIARQILGVDDSFRVNGAGIRNLEAELPLDPAITQLAPTLVQNLLAELAEEEVDGETIATPQVREG